MINNSWKKGIKLISCRNMEKGHDLISDRKIGWRGAILSYFTMCVEPGVCSQTLSSIAPRRVSTSQREEPESLLSGGRQSHCHWYGSNSRTRHMSKWGCNREKMHQSPRGRNVFVLVLPNVHKQYSVWQRFPLSLDLYICFIFTVFVISQFRHNH